MVADKFPNGLIGPIGLNPNGLIGPIGLRIIRTIGSMRRGYHFPINFTSISTTISCQKGLDVVHLKSNHPGIVLKRTAQGD